MSGLLNVATMAAHTAGKIIMQNFDRLDRIVVKVKEDGSYVSSVDHHSEKAIIDCIHKYYPGHNILSEESFEVSHISEKDYDADYLWIIDPLDGTKNFIHGVPHFAVSIAVQEKGRVVLSVVYDPFKDETFTASLDKGSVLNNKRIRLVKNSHTMILSNSLFATGLPRRGLHNQDAQLSILNFANNNLVGCRKMGSVSLDLAYIAANRWNCFVDAGLKIWDFAAGLLIATEAGAHVDFFDVDSSKDGVIVGQEHLIKSVQKNCSLV